MIKTANSHRAQETGFLKYGEEVYKLISGPL
jgi:hypothetical protein